MRFVYLHLLILFANCYVCEIISKSTNIVCQPNDKFVKEAKCTLKAVSWEKSKLQMDCFLMTPLKKPTVHMQLLKKDYSNQYQPFLINISFSICDVIERRNVVFYSNEVWKTIKKYTNANHTCPFVGHLFARDLSLDLVTFPPNTPLGSYLLTTNFIENFRNGSKESFGSIKWYYDMMQKRERRLKPKENNNRTNFLK